MEEIKKIIKMLTKKEKSYLISLLFFSIIISLLDLIGIASIMPFIALLTNPELIKTNALLSFLYLNLDYGNEISFQIFLGSISLILLVASSILRCVNTYYTNKFIVFCEAGLSLRIFENYLKKSYQWYLSRHTSLLTKNIMTEIPKVVGEVLNPTITLVSQLFFVMIVSIMLAYINIYIALVAALGIIFIYFLIALVTKQITINHAQIRFIHNETRVRAVSDSFGGIREVKATSAEDFFANIYRKASYQYAKSHALTSLIYTIPRYAMEIVSMGGLLIFLLIFLTLGYPIDEILPLVSVFAMSAYKLMPALQNIFSAVGLIRFSKISLNSIYKDYTENNFEESSELNQIASTWKKLTLDSINFAYPNTSNYILKNISLEIYEGDYVGICGPSGSGKSTLIDVLIGLLQANSGSIFVDSVKMDKSSYLNWCKSNIGYIPQQIFLSDDSVAMNIAYGIPVDAIDMELVKKVSKISQIDEYINRSLPNGYNTVLGEKGLILSGGQRQRIAIARALYRNPSILIFDEATNALDLQTEKLLIKSLKDSDPKLCVIMISHRVETYKNFNKIYQISNGQIQ